MGHFFFPGPSTSISQVLGLQLQASVVLHSVLAKMQLITVFLSVLNWGLNLRPFAY